MAKVWVRAWLSMPMTKSYGYAMMAIILNLLSGSIRMTLVWKWVLVRQISNETHVVQVRSTFYQAKASDWTDVSGENVLVLFKSLQDRGLITGESRSRW